MNSKPLTPAGGPGHVLVTGAAGFIGSHLVERLLDEGWRVWGVDNFDPFYPRETKESNIAAVRLHPRFRLAEGDLRDDAFLVELFREGEFDSVLHLAARVGARPSIEAAEEYFDCNVMATLQLLESMRHFGVKTVVFASSSSVYGSALRSGPVSEEDAAVSPRTPYAASKRTCELLLHAYAHLHELNCLSLRLFSVYGARGRRDLPLHRLANAFLRGDPLPPGNASAGHDFVYVGDVVDALTAALYRAADLTAAGPRFRVLNIGTGRTTTLSELANRLADALGTRYRTRGSPPFPQDLPRARADIRRARELLDFVPRVSIEQGLDLLIAWLRERRDQSRFPGYTGHVVDRTVAAGDKNA